MPVEVRFVPFEPALGLTYGLSPCRTWPGQFSSHASTCARKSERRVARTSSAILILPPKPFGRAKTPDSLPRRMAVAMRPSVVALSSSLNLLMMNLRRSVSQYQAFQAQRTNNGDRRDEGDGKKALGDRERVGTDALLDERPRGAVMGISSLLDSLLEAQSEGDAISRAI